MLVITAEMLHGTIRAGSPEDTVMAGGVPEGEWPPSPARLFSALVAGDGTRDRCRVTDGAELFVLEALGPPTIYAVPLTAIETTPLVPRFVVKDKSAEGVVQNYPARTSAEVRPGVKASPHIASVVYAWDVSVGDDTVTALARRAARVGYLGCADSPVRLTVSTDPPSAGLDEWRPGAASGTALPVAYEGFTAALDAAFDAWSAGEPMRRSWIPNRWERYAVNADDGGRADSRPTVVWLEFARRVAGRKALLVSETLRAAVLDHYDRLAGPGAGDAGRRAPWWLHGHDIPDDVARPYQLARFLPLTNVGYRHSDGAVHGAAIWLPLGSPPEGIEAVRAAAHRIRELRAPGLAVEISPRRDEPGRWSTRPKRWIGPSRRWFSATPAVAERGSRGGPDLAEVRRWFANAGHPEPRTVRVSPVPTGAGVTRLRPSEVHRRGGDAYPFYWLDVEFDDEVEGPLCVGRGRSFGMGFLAPVGVREFATDVRREG